MPKDNPAFDMEGITLGGGWQVVELLERADSATGSNFSVGYIAERNSDGTRAFLKAFDLSEALDAEDMMDRLGELTRLYNFEKQLLEMCGQRRLSRVVKAIDSGQAVVHPDSRIGRVPYIIFECAECDIRHSVNAGRNVDLSWALSALHDAAIGLRQLHASGVAHQDIKPSNILVFKDGRAKIADLGRASRQGVSGPIDNSTIAGMLAYAPPEQLCGHADADWTVRRLSCDTYQLGLLILYCFTQMNLTVFLVDEMHRSGLIPCTEKYELVLPEVMTIYSEILDNISPYVPADIRAEILPLVQDLTYPDPARRTSRPVGKAKPGEPLTLEQVASRIHGLAVRARYSMVRA